MRSAYHEFHRQTASIPKTCQPRRTLYCIYCLLLVSAFHETGVAKIVLNELAKVKGGWKGRMIRELVKVNGIQIIQSAGMQSATGTCLRQKACLLLTCKNWRAISMQCAAGVLGNVIGMPCNLNDILYSRYKAQIEKILPKKNLCNE